MRWARGVACRGGARASTGVARSRCAPAAPARGRPALYGRLARVVRGPGPGSGPGPGRVAVSRTALLTRMRAPARTRTWRAEWWKAELSHSADGCAPRLLRVTGFGGPVGLGQSGWCRGNAEPPARRKIRVSGRAAGWPGLQPHPHPTPAVEEMGSGFAAALTWEGNKSEAGCARRRTAFVCSLCI